MRGVTGNIEFTEVGLRKNYQLQILDVGFQQVHSRIANWSDQTGLIFERSGNEGSSSKLAPSPQLMRVTTVAVSEQLEIEALFDISGIKQNYYK